MEESKKDHMHGSMCGGWCGCGHNHFVLRWILGMVILVLVFILGVKVGEIRALFEADGYGHGYMMRGRYMNPHPIMYVQDQMMGGEAAAPKASATAK